MKMLLPLALAAGLLACAPAAPIGSTTTVDEKVGLGVELAYQAAGNAALVGLRTGVIPATARPCIAALDARAHAAVRTVRAAYDAGNGAPVGPASLTRAKAAVQDLLTQKGC